MPDSTHIDVSGGWYVASDYLQYSTTYAIATWHLLAAYRDFAFVFDDEKMANGLDSKNGVKDILDEAKWGLEWLMKMNPQPDWMFNQLADDRDHRSMRIPKIVFMAREMSSRLTLLPENRRACLSIKTEQRALPPPRLNLPAVLHWHNISTTPILFLRKMIITKAIMPGYWMLSSSPLKRLVLHKLLLVARHSFMKKIIEWMIWKWRRPAFTPW